jgi:hypothetical protein
MSDVVLELRRDGDLDEHGHVSGYLWAMRGRTGLVYFHTKEKGHGRVRLRPGTLTMEHSVMNHFPDVRCLRPLGQANAQLAVCLIHPVDFSVKPDPWTRSGCCLCWFEKQPAAGSGQIGEDSEAVDGCAPKRKAPANLRSLRAGACHDSNCTPTVFDLDPVASRRCLTVNVVPLDSATSVVFSWLPAHQEFADRKLSSLRSLADCEARRH